jgi:SNF2 family DNA or RNA helicase
MIEINPARFKTPPFAHQVVGTKAIVTNNNFAIFDEMGAGKTKQVVDAACVLYDAGEIDTVIIACPAQVKTVWLNPEFGEVAKHAWMPSTVQEYSARYSSLTFSSNSLNWVVVSYEFLRQEIRLTNLITRLRQFKRKTLLVLDESIFVKNPKAVQTRACWELRKVCQRAVLLNGTPISNNPLDLYAQFAVLDKSILGFKNYFAFRNHHAKMGGYLGKQVVGFVNLPELQTKLKPFVLRRLKEDCLDLPPKLFTQITCTLSPATWKIYRSMRDDMVVWLDQASVSEASQAAVKSMRLSQITSGFLGGVVETIEADEDTNLFNPDAILQKQPPKEIGDEKLRVFMEWLEERLGEDPNFRVVVWCRFRAELNRAFDHVVKTYPQLTVVKIQGGQKKKDREAAIEEFQVKDNGPAVLFGNPQAGGFGLTMTKAHTVVYLSNDYNLLTRLQSEDRVHRPGQIHKVTYVDVLAVGPEGQKTVDNVIVRALRKKEDISKMTTEQWRSALLEE